MPIHPGPNSLADFEREARERDSLHGDKPSEPVKPLEYVDEALAAIPTAEEIDQFCFHSTPPRWINFALEWRFKLKELAAAGLSTSRSAGTRILEITEVVGADGKGVAAPCAISGCALMTGHATLQSATEQFTQGDAHPCDISRAVREQTIEECAVVAKKSNFVDGPKGTIEGQIAGAIRALKA